MAEQDQAGTTQSKLRDASRRVLTGAFGLVATGLVVYPAIAHMPTSVEQTVPYVVGVLVGAFAGAVLVLAHPLVDSAFYG